MARHYDLAAFDEDDFDRWEDRRELDAAQIEGRTYEWEPAEPVPAEGQSDR